jgi:hypothetical protein
MCAFFAGAASAQRRQIARNSFAALRPLRGDNADPMRPSGHPRALLGKAGLKADFAQQKSRLPTA